MLLEKTNFLMRTLCQLKVSCADEVNFEERSFRALGSRWCKSAKSFP